jgi:hypothetical protein
MGKVIDYSTYFNYLHIQKDNSLQNVTSILDNVHPRIESVIADEITRQFPSSSIYEFDKVKPSFDDAVILSLCGLLASYLGELITRSNAYNATADNIDEFINDLIKSMLKKMKRKENDSN